MKAPKLSQQSDMLGAYDVVPGRHPWSGWSGPFLVLASAMHQSTSDCGGAVPAVMVVQCIVLPRCGP